MPDPIRVQVTVDTDELREWANRHADAGRHGVAHVLYAAANDGETLTEQALREARREAAVEVLDVRGEGRSVVIARLLDSADRLANPEHRGNQFAWPTNAAMLRSLARALAATEGDPS